MIRFVDLRGNDTGYRFAFFSTGQDRFCSFNGSQAWDSVDEFREDYDGDDLDRYIRLCPSWSYDKEQDPIFAPEVP